MGRLRRQKHVLVWLAIVAFLSNVLAGIAFAPAMAQALADDVLGPIVICTTDGAKALSEDGSPGRHAPSGHCPACTLHAQLALAVPLIASTIDFPPQRGPRTQPVVTRPNALQFLPGSVRSRAPPLFA